MRDSDMKRAEKYFSRLAGACLGTMCGDALGMPVEGLSAAEIAARHGRLDEMLPGRLEAGSYTDDSQMMIAILETLAQTGGLDPAHLAGRFVAHFEPRRGYGGRIHGVMERLRCGIPWDQAGTDSFGNGGAMRVAPAGVYFCNKEPELITAALNQCRITHHHPRGLAGALAQALACGLACIAGLTGEPKRRDDFIGYLVPRVAEVDGHVARRIGAIPDLTGCDAQTAVARLAGEFACDVTAAEAVPPALGAFLWAPNPEEATVLAVSLGGDTDTVGAMAGALSGAYWGVEALPTRWLDQLENGKYGQKYVLKLCRNATAIKIG